MAEPRGAPVGYAYTRAVKSKKDPKSKLRNLNTAGLLTCCYESDDTSEGDAEEQSELREAELELYKQLDRKMGLFSKRVCGCWCLTPAMLIWSMNLICAAVHLCMGVVVMDEGQKNRENMGFQVVSVVGEWRNRSADGYFSTVRKYARDDPAEDDEPSTATSSDEMASQLAREMETVDDDEE